jgi:hypothetical protein
MLIAGWLSVKRVSEAEFLEQPRLNMIGHLYENNNGWFYNELLFRDHSNNPETVITSSCNVY